MSIDSDLDLLGFGAASGAAIGVGLLVLGRWGSVRLQMIAFPLAVACGTTIRDFRIRFDVGEGLLVAGAAIVMLLAYSLGSLHPPMDLRVHRFAVAVVGLGIWVGPPETDFAPIVFGAGVGLLLFAPRAATTESIVAIDYSLVVLLAIIGGAGFTRETAGALAGLTVPVLVGFAVLALPAARRADRVVLVAVGVWHLAVVGVAARAVAADQAGDRGWPAVVATVLIGAVSCAATWHQRSGAEIRTASDRPT